MSIYKILYIFFIVFTIASNPLISNEVRQVSKEGGYSIQFPSEWEVIRGVMGADVIAIAPITDPKDLFRENANIIYTDVDIPLSPEDYYNYNIKSLENLLVDFDLEENEDTIISGVPARKLVFTHRLGIVNAKALQYLIIKEKRAYVISFTADPLDFDKFRERFEGIASTFQFKTSD